MSFDFWGACEVKIARATNSCTLYQFRLGRVAQFVLRITGLVFVGSSRHVQPPLRRGSRTGRPVPCGAYYQPARNRAFGPIFLFQGILKDFFGAHTAMQRQRLWVAVFLKVIEIQCDTIDIRKPELLQFFFMEPFFLDQGAVKEGCVGIFCFVGKFGVKLLCDLLLDNRKI